MFSRKRFLEVPPDPRTNFERRTTFVDSIFTPPCRSELEKFYVERNKKGKKTKQWEEKELNQTLDLLETK